MSSEPLVLTLAEICNDVSYGYTESASPEPVGPKFLRITDIQGGTVDWNQVPFCPASNTDAQKYRLEVGDIVVARTGNSTGENAQITKEPPTAVFASYLIRFRPDKNRVNPFFVGYQLRTERFRQHVLSVRGGSAQPGANAKQLGTFQIQLASPALQDFAVETLMSIDNRISILRETNVILEAIAQALFKSWFVDFDPVHAKQQGQLPEGMDEATAALFPDSFEESELGLVPKGWSVGTIADSARLNPESWTAKTHPKTVAYVDLANTKNNSITDISEYSFEDAPSRARRVLRDGDTIIGTVRPGNRSFAFISNAASNLTGSTGFAVLRPSFPENTEFVFLAATSDESIDHLAHVADGGAYPAVRPEVVAKIKAVIPDKAVMTAFHEAAAPIFAKIGQAQQQSQSLATIRDTLLPRLISGHLRLPDVNTAIEETCDVV
jgi:type I restriction enzyme, S subunit